MRTFLVAAVVLAVAASAALAQTDEGTGSQRAAGAPGKACAQHERGSQAFRDCVRAAAKQRGRGVGRACAQHERGSQAFRDCVRAAVRERARRPGPARGGPPFGQACAQHERGSQAFRTCRRAQHEQWKAQRAERKAALRQCKQQHPRGSEAFRSCVRAAVRP